MQNTLKNNDYFYRGKGEVYEKWSFRSKKEKNINIFNIILPVFILSSFLIIIT